jgi:hypothetical protein
MVTGHLAAVKWYRATFILSTANYAPSSSATKASLRPLRRGVLAFTNATITETGGTVRTTGNGANAVFAYGSGAHITISGTKITAVGQYAHGIMASGGGSITATDITVSTAGASGAAIATATINLTGVKLADSSGTLLDAAASSWGTSGSNGGQVTVNAKAQTLTGSVVADKISTVTLHLTDGSKLTGAINTADSAKKVMLSLDSTSEWTVTGTSHVTVLNDSAGTSGTKITNIVGHGHNVYYSKSANLSLNGNTYTLAGGGKLVPV